MLWSIDKVSYFLIRFKMASHVVGGQYIFIELFVLHSLDRKYFFLCYVFIGIISLSDAPKSAQAQSHIPTRK
jgi:hypothetical protein